jgi:glycogen operon protein
MAVADWEDSSRRRLVMLLAPGGGQERRLAILVNGDRRACRFALPERRGWNWAAALHERFAVDPLQAVPGRSVAFMVERRTAASYSKRTDLRGEGS